MLKRTAVFIAFAMTFAFSDASALTDSYLQTFNGLQDGASIEGADSFDVTTGDPDKAIVESGDTATGSGKALIIAADTTPIQLERPTSSSVSPTWVEYVTKPGLGGDERSVPDDGIAAVTFSPSGSIMVSDGAQWTNTGKTFDTNTWYRIQLRLDFSSHTYKFYLSPADTPKTPFVADKEGLAFIDPSVSSLTRFGFMGSYQKTAAGDSKVDEVLVHTVDKLQIVSSPQTLVKGMVSGIMTVQLQNAISEPQTAWTDLTLELAGSTITLEFSADKVNWVPIRTLVIPEGAQQATFYFKDNTLGRHSITVGEYPDRGWSDAIQEQKIVSEGEFFGITTTTPQVAGRPFDVHIVAKDVEGLPDTSYSGNIEIFVSYVDPSSGMESISPAEEGGFVQGMKDISMSYPDAGVIKIGVKDSSDGTKIGYSGEIVFTPDKFTVSAESPQVVGKPFTMNIQALSVDNQPTRNYRGTVKLEAVGMNPPSSAGGSFTPPQASPELFQNGTAAVTASFNRWGTLAVRASDVAAPERLGQSEPIIFVPKAISVKVKAPSQERSFFYVNENMEITVSVVGFDGLPVDNYQGSVTLSPTPQFSIPNGYVFKEADKGQKTFVISAGAAGNYTLEVKATADGLSAVSEKIEVKDATIQVSTTAAPVGTTVVEIQLLDSKGKRITTENEMKVTIILHEENDNGSVFFSEAGKPILFKNGIAKIVIGNNEAETVSVVAKSSYGLKVINGKVTFGRAGASGVGALMLRETKD